MLGRAQLPHFQATRIPLWPAQSPPGLVAHLCNFAWREPISDRIALRDCPRSAEGVVSQENLDAVAWMLLFSQSHAFSDHARVRKGRGPS